MSKDPLFVAKVRDVVGCTSDPHERALVLCVDEKTQIQALKRTQPVFPMLPGTPARASHDYVRPPPASTPRSTSRAAWSSRPSRTRHRGQRVVVRFRLVKRDG